MLVAGAGETLSRILARRMAATSVAVLVLVMFVYSIQDLSDYRRLRQVTLNENAVAVAEALHGGRDPASLPLYRDYPDAYGFRVFDHRALAKRHVLASANTRWFPPVQPPMPSTIDPDDAPDPTAGSTKLVEGFSLTRSDPLQSWRRPAFAMLTHRVAFDDRHYWVQTYMVGDPAFAFKGVILDDLVKHILLPALFIIPALTLSIFLVTRTVLRPLRRLSDSAKLIGTALARGQALVPVPESGIAKEFADVAETINAILSKLDHTLQSQKQFISDIAHELRTPLAVMLLDMSQLPRSAARERIKNDLKELAQLVNELLRLAQAEDVIATEAREFDIVTVTLKVVDEAVSEAITKQQLVELNCKIKPLLLSGSVSLIEIAIRNLVGNALRYSPSRTVVTISVQPGPIVVVEDRGPGIPPEHRDHMFERFWRIDHPSGSGAGVGLALVRRIAQLHNGSVRMEERSGGGTRMILSFAQAALSNS
jgi:signal transduction histidine kinase